MWSRIAIAGAASLAIVIVAYFVGESFGRHAGLPAVQVSGVKKQAKGSDIRIDFGRKSQSDLALTNNALTSHPDGEIETLVSRPMLFVDGRVNVAKGSATAALRASYKKIRAFMAVHHLTAAGPPIAINEDFDTAKQIWMYRAGIPLAALPHAPPAPAEGISIGQTYGGTAARFVHIGDPNQAQPTYAKVDNWMHAKQLTASGPSWEEYVSDPQAPVSKWRTNIYVPLG